MLTNTMNTATTDPNTVQGLRDGPDVCVWGQTTRESCGGRVSSGGSSVVAVDTGTVDAWIAASLVVIATLPLSSSSKSASKHTAGDDSMSKLSLKWRVDSLDSMVLAVCSSVETVADTGVSPSITVVDVNKRLAMRRFDSSDDEDDEEDEENPGVATGPAVSDEDMGVRSITRDGLIV